jgi:hypothetical protein
VKKNIFAIIAILTLTACTQEFTRVGNPPTQLPQGPDQINGGQVTAKSQVNGTNWEGSALDGEDLVIYGVSFDKEAESLTLRSTDSPVELTIPYTIDENDFLVAENASGVRVSGKIIVTDNNKAIRLELTTNGADSTELFKVASSEALDDSLNAVDSCMASEFKCADTDASVGENDFYITGKVVAGGSCGETKIDRCSDDGKQMVEVSCLKDGSGYKETTMDCQCRNGHCIDTAKISGIEPQEFKETLLSPAKKPLPSVVGAINHIQLLMISPGTPLSPAQLVSPRP